MTIEQFNDLPLEKKSELIFSNIRGHRHHITSANALVFQKIYVTFHVDEQKRITSAQATELPAGGEKLGGDHAILFCFALSPGEMPGIYFIHRHEPEILN